MPTETLKKFAEELKSARESKQITLQQIANKTKIDIKFLQAIENANYDLLPELYIKAFIKEYSQLIDLDPKEIIKKFEAAKKGLTKQPEAVEQTQPVIPEPVEPLPVEKPITEEKPFPVEKSKKEFESREINTPDITPIANNMNKKNYSNYIYAGVICVLVLALIYFVFIRNESTDIVTENQNIEATENNQDRFEVANKSVAKDTLSEQAQTTFPQDDSLRIRISTSAAVWVKVLADGKMRIQERVPQDTKLSYAAGKTFSVSVGNAGVVKLYYNNKLLDKLGRVGEIRNVFISPDTIKYLTIAPQSKNENKPKTKN